MRKLRLRLSNRLRSRNQLRIWTLKSIWFQCFLRNGYTSCLPNFWGPTVCQSLSQGLGIQRWREATRKTERGLCGCHRCLCLFVPLSHCMRNLAHIQFWGDSSWAQDKEEVRGLRGGGCSQERQQQVPGLSGLRENSTLGHGWGAAIIDKSHQIRIFQIS